MKKVLNIFIYILLIIIFYVILYYVILGVSSFFPHNKFFNGAYIIFLFILNPIIAYKIAEIIMKNVKKKLNSKNMN